MKRKVIQIAGSTQLVSLPRKWALKQGIKKGDEIEVVEEGDRIILETSRKEEVKKASLNMTTVDKFIKRPITALYKQGYDEIDVSYEDPLLFDKVLQVCDLLLGFEVVDHRQRYCKIKNVALGLETEFDSVFKRIFLLDLSMARECLNCIKACEYERLKDITKQEITNNKLVMFCERLLNTKGYAEFTKTNSVYAILFQLEQVADVIRNICLYLDKNQKIKLSKETYTMFSDVVEQLNLFYTLFYQFDLDKLIGFHDKKKELDGKSLELFKKKGKDEVVVIQYLYRLNDIIHHMTTNL